MKKRTDLQVLVAGCGSIGRRHLRNLKALGARKLWAFDPSDKAFQKARSEVRNLERLLNLNDAKRAGIECALICTPTAFHLKPAETLARQRIHLFIEKPVAHDSAKGKALVKLARANRLITLTGCNYRFHPGIAAAKKAMAKGFIGRWISARLEYGMYLPDWHPWEDYRFGYSARKGLGGGVLLDRIHEIDLAGWLLGNPRRVVGFARRASSLQIETEDNVEIIFEYPGNALASIHLDYIKRNRTGRIEITGEKGTLLFEFENNRLSLHGPHGTKRLWQRANYDWNKMYRDEITYFLNQVAAKRKTFYDAADGLATVRLTEQVRLSDKLRKVVSA